MSKSVPYPIVIQLVLLQKVQRDTEFDVNSILGDLSAFDLSKEFSFYFPGYHLYELPSPWAFPSFLLLPEVGLQEQWSMLVSRNFIEPKLCESSGKQSWCITPFGASQIKSLESLLENPLFLKDINILFLKILKKLEELEKVESEWQSIEPKLGDISESDISKKLKEHMVQLHRLNEFKDISQNIISQLANKSGKTMRQMYDELDIDIEDPEDAD